MFYKKFDKTKQNLTHLNKSFLPRFFPDYYLSVSYEFLADQTIRIIIFSLQKYINFHNDGVKFCLLIV